MLKHTHTKIRKIRIEYVYTVSFLSIHKKYFELNILNRSFNSLFKLIKKDFLFNLINSKMFSTPILFRETMQIKTGN